MKTTSRKTSSRAVTQRNPPRSQIQGSKRSVTQISSSRQNSQIEAHAQTQTVRVMRQRDLDSSCHRLSQVPNNLKITKTSPTKQNEMIVQSYMKSHPEAIDKRPPGKKLEDIDSQLEDQNLERPQKFELLVRKKSLSCIAYGEGSIQALRSYSLLGAFYNEEEKPEGALRNLSKAHQLERDNEISKDESAFIAVEMADSYMQMKEYNQSYNYIKPHIDTEITDKKLKYKRDILVARTLNQKKMYSEAIEKYDNAIESFKSIEDDESLQMAQLYEEAGSNAEQVQNLDKIKEAYSKALSIYQKLELNDDIQRVIKKIPKDHSSDDNFDKDNHL